MTIDDPVDEEKPRGIVCDGPVEEEGVKSNNDDFNNDVDAVNNSTSFIHKKNVPWATSSIKHGKDESIIQTTDAMKDACYFLMPDWKVRISIFLDFTPLELYFVLCDDHFDTVHWCLPNYYYVTDMRS